MKRIISITLSLIIFSLSGCVFINPKTLDFGSDETTKTFKLTVIGNVEWSITPSESWITVKPDSEQGTAAINVTVDRTGLEEDSYEATLNISTNPNVPCPDVIVKMTVGHGTTTSTTTINPCPPEEPYLCVDEDYDINQYWCCDEEYPVCGKVEYVDGEPKGTCLPDGTLTSTTTTAPEPPEGAALFLSPDPESDLLFYIQHEDTTIVYYYGFDNTEDGMKLTHVAFEDGSAIIFRDDFISVQWIMDGVTAAVYILDDEIPFDPRNAYHEVTDGQEFSSYTLNIYPEDLSGILTQMEAETGQQFSDASDFLTNYGIGSFNDIVTKAQQSGDDQPRFIAAAVGFSAAAAYLSMEAAESSSAKFGTIIDSPPKSIAKYLVQFIVSLLASKFNDEYGPQPPTDPDDPGIDVQLCRGQSSISYICHYMFFKPSYPGSAGPCIDLCFPTMKCFTDICMPKTLSSQSAQDFKDHFFQGE